jgi:GDSL-like lipase/acylhydrolase family protein
VVWAVALATVAAIVVAWRTRTAGSSALRPGPLPPGRSLRVVLFGDSLAAQATPYFRDALTGSGRVMVETNGSPGTAICDALAAMKRTVSHFRPDVAVVEFSGNTLTPCMRDRAGVPLTGAGLIDRYRRDAQSATRLLDRRGATIYWVGVPPDRDPSLSAITVGINAIYRDLANRFSHVRFVDAGAALTDHGRYVDFLPCVPNEPCLGGILDGVRTNRVRSPDGIHFCPQDVSENAQCPVWSSGAFRFGTSMAAPVLKDFSLTARG